MDGPPGPLAERIADCHRLWSTATDPETSLTYYYELQGLLVVAGRRFPMTEIEAGSLRGAYERGLQDGHTLRRLAP